MTLSEKTLRRTGKCEGEPVKNGWRVSRAQTHNSERPPDIEKTLGFAK